MPDSASDPLASIGAAFLEPYRSGSAECRMPTTAREPNSESGLRRPYLIYRKVAPRAFAQNADQARLRGGQTGPWPEIQMTILIAFGSIEGQTRKIAHFAKKKIRELGDEVVLLDTADKTAPVSLAGVDKVILAASVHERRHPAAFEGFLAAHRHELEARHTLLISVSLSAAFPEGLAEAEDYLVEMKMRTRFTPDAEALVAGAIRTRKYDDFAIRVLRQVVLRDRKYDVSKDEHEFTDWNALSLTLANFLAADAPSEFDFVRSAARTQP